MDINSVIKQNIQDVELQLNVNLSEKSLKPMVFIDNTNFNKSENPLAIVHLDLFDAKDVISIKDKVKTEDAFTISNLLGDKSVYCVWGKDNLNSVKTMLENCGYAMTERTIFFDLKNAANVFYNENIDNFEDVQRIISYDAESLDLIFSSKESIMYSLFIDMINKGYVNSELEDTLNNLIQENEEASAKNIIKGNEFRNSKSSIEFERSELENLEKFVEYMQEYNMQMEDYLNNKIKNSNLLDVHKMLLSEKATMCRFKKDVYTYTKALLDANKKNDFETYKFYYKTLDMYVLMEDAYILSNEMKNDNAFSSFVADLGNVFKMSTATYANTYLLRKNVLAKLTK